MAAPPSSSPPVECLIISNCCGPPAANRAMAVKNAQVVSMYELWDNRKITTNSSNAAVWNETTTFPGLYVSDSLPPIRLPITMPRPVSIIMYGNVSDENPASSTNVGPT